MCTDCRNGISRRGLLRLAGAGLAFALARPLAARAAGGEATHMTAEEALERLLAGNRTYLGAPQVCATDLAATRARLAQSQAPWATILTCSDSRVPPELLFGGLGAGEIFVARNAGNMADTATMGTIEYGAAMLGVPLIMVLGHERCGAVAAACEVAEKNTVLPGSIAPMVQAIVPAAEAVRGRAGDCLDNAVRESARRTAAKIASDSAIVRERVAAGKVKVVAGRYDLDDGRVEIVA